MPLFSQPYFAELTAGAEIMPYYPQPPAQSALPPDQIPPPVSEVQPFRRGPSPLQRGALCAAVEAMRRVELASILGPTVW